MSDAYCSMIHGGLFIVVDQQGTKTSQCCVTNNLTPANSDIWHDVKFQLLRQKNSANRWDPSCAGCKRLEDAGQVSFRQGMNQGLNMNGHSNLSGPVRIDLKFDISCNLACRTCGPAVSTFWQKYLSNNNNNWPGPAATVNSNEAAINVLQTLDLSNLKMLVFAGGETLLGQSHWKVAEWLADNVPNAEQNLTLCFQTNGTQPILKRNYELIDRFHLVKMHISLDGIESKFEYLRWPAAWNQVVDNILTMREHAPSNTMFLVEETLSIFNLAYTQELHTWTRNNFSTNKDGDVINHTRHLAHGTFSLSNMTQEYVDAISATEYRNLIPSDWKENSIAIKQMISTIQHHDQQRSQSWQTTFPGVAEFYNRYL